MNMYNVCPAGKVFGLLLLMAGAQAAQAADSIADLANKSLEELGEYKVEAPTRTPLALAQVPGAVSVFTYDEIQSNSAQTLPDLMRLVPGMNVRWNPMVQTMDLRGFGSSPFTSRVLLLIDGVPYNSWDMGGFPQHPSLDFFNLASVKHLEVVRGGASSLYGENATNGVVNMVTLSGEELQSARLSVYAGDLSTRNASLLYGSRIGEGGSVLVSARASHAVIPMQLWIEDGSGGVNATDLFIKGKYAGWQLSAYQRKDDMGGFHREEGPPTLPPGSVLESAPKVSQRVDIFAAQYAHASPDDRWSLKFNASHSMRYGTSCSACHAAPQSAAALTTEKDGYEDIANLQAGLSMLTRHDIVLGAEARRRTAGGDPRELGDGANEAPPPGVTVISAYRKHAVYLQDLYHVPALPLTVIGGLRLDSDTSPSEFGSHLFPHAALIYAPRSDLTVRGGWTQSARYPSFTEQYAASWFLAVVTPTGVVPLAQFKPQYNLRPEFVTETDFGVEYRPQPWWQVKLDVYQKNVRNFIVLTYPGGAFRDVSFENHPNEALTHGVEFEWRADLTDHWSTFINFASQRNTQQGSGVDTAGRPIEFTYSSPNKINLGVTWAPDADTRAEFDLSWKDRYMAPAFWYGIAFPEDPSPRPLPAYTHVNAHLSRAFSVPGASGRPLTVVLDGRNLLNTRAYETLTGFGGRTAGRTLYAGLRYDVAP